MTLDGILSIYNGSSGDDTNALYASLLRTEQPRALVAVKLLQCCKASERAKTYSRRYAAMAYDKKDWAIGELCRTLVVCGPDVVESWGWGFDAKAIGFEHVLYVDVPGCGQVSFHTSHRRDGHDYAGTWDRARGQSPHRICLWAEAILNGREATNEGEKDVVHAGTEGAAAQGDEGQQGEQVEVQKTFDL